jgi:hypothetical protein
MDALSQWYMNAPHSMTSSVAINVNYPYIYIKIKAKFFPIAKLWVMDEATAKGFLKRLEEIPQTDEKIKFTMPPCTQGHNITLTFKSQTVAYFIMKIKKALESVDVDRFINFDSPLLT